MDALRTLVVIESAARDLARARDCLAAAGRDATCRLLVDGRDPRLEQFAAAGAFDLILLPSRGPGWAAGRHPSARRLTRATQAEVRLVGRR
jgi:hypothetical protein